MNIIDLLGVLIFQNSQKSENQPDKVSLLLWELLTAMALEPGVDQLRSSSGKTKCLKQLIIDIKIEPEARRTLLSILLTPLAGVFLFEGLPVS